MSGVNRVIILGNLGNDPELRSFPDGSQMASISVATSDTWTDKQTGERKGRTEWHRIILRDRGNYRLAQLAGQYLRKGSKVYIEGKLQTRKYSDAQGIERYVTEIIADTMQFLDGKQQDDQQQTQGQMPQQQSGYQQTPKQQPAPQYQPKANYKQPGQNYAPANQAPPMQQQYAAPNFNDFDDDIPFS